MTSRQTGKRLQSIRRRSGSVRGTYGRGQEKGGSGGKQLAQLVICGGIFVALVAAKLLLPGKMAQVDRFLSQAMEQNVDVQAVFSAVGRAFSGEGGVSETMEEVYQAVFRPQEDGLGGTARPVVKTGIRLQEDAALGSLRAYLPASGETGEDAGNQAGDEDADGPTAPPAEVQDAESLAHVMYSDENLPEGVSMEQAILGFDYTAPVSGVLTSDFGYREHPVEGEERFHYGVDLAADSGTEIRCFADGKVTAVGESSSYGRYCIVAHEGGYATLYAHCSRVTATSGAEVRRGEKIAEVGQTGVATGPHLHFELQRNGAYLNPIYYVAAV